MQKNTAYRNLTIGALALFALIFFIFWLLKPFDKAAVFSGHPLPLSSSENSSAPTFGDVNRMPTASQAQPSSTTVSEVHALHKEFTSARDLRVLYEKIKSQPESGGIYYASLINQRCWQAREIIDAVGAEAASATNTPHAIASRRDAAIGKLKTLCAGFLESEISVDQLASIVRSSAASKDPLVALQRRHSQINPESSPNEYRDVLRQLFSQQSPEVLLNSAIGLTSEGYFFDGQTYTLGSEGNAILFESAKALAVCELGDTCDAIDYLLVSACAKESICVDSRSEMIKKMLVLNRKDPAADMAYVMELAKKISNAIRNSDADLFIPKKTLSKP